jgi:hypothetical protein
LHERLVGEFAETVDDINEIVVSGVKRVEGAERVSGTKDARFVFFLESTKDAIPDDQEAAAPGRGRRERRSEEKLRRTRQKKQNERRNLKFLSMYLTFTAWCTLKHKKKEREYDFFMTKEKRSKTNLWCEGVTKMNSNQRGNLPTYLV